MALQLNECVHELCIIGSGFGGLGAAIEAKHRGIQDYVVLERSVSVGGTWRDNTYPGCACDVPSYLYSFSFQQNPDWSRSYPAQPELQAYLEKVVDDYQLRGHIRFGVNVESIRWNDESQYWSIESADGESVRARSVISATGPLSQPSLPDIDGLQSFGGVLFHSARWDHQNDLSGLRVGIIGTGASAIQIVPAIAKDVAELVVFQRTPSWVLPRDDRPAPRWRQRLYRLIPALQRLHRWRIYLRQELFSVAFIGKGRLGLAASRRISEEVKSQINASISDPLLAAALTPDYRPGCKRILISNHWYPALNRENVSLVTDSIEQVTPKGIRTSNGKEIELDALILATGFAVSTFPAPMRIIGRDGVDLADHWNGAASTEMGLAVSGYPNLWFLAGPGTGLGHNSIVFMIEAQLHTIGQALTYQRKANINALEVKPEVEAASYAELSERMKSTVWASGCSSWYQSSDGRVDTVWPGTTIEYWWRTRRFHPERFRPVAPRFRASATDR